MSNKKLTIAFDFDNTLINSNLAMIELFKIDNPEIIHTNYPKYEFVSEWNYQDVLPTMTNETVNQYFNDARLFNLMTFFMDAKTSMDDLVYNLIKQGHKILVVSKGTEKNILLKEIFLRDRLPYFDVDYNLIGIPLEANGKSDKYLKGADILIDDVDSNFNNSVKYKLLFANQGLKSWNKNGLSNGELTTVKSVTELSNVIYDIINFERSR